VIFFNMETIPAKSKDKDLAWQWVTYYAGPTIQAALPAQISFPSPRQDVYESDAWKNAVQKISQNANVPKISALPGVGPYPFVRYSALSDAIHPILQKVVPLGTLSAKDAIAQATQKGNAVLSQGTS
jgi:spermidine/putrescine-binding protein